MSEPIAIAVFDIDGVVRDVGGSYRRAIADTVEHFTQQAHRPTPQDIDTLKGEGIWNNDWKASQELICRYFESQGRSRESLGLDYDTIVDFFQRRYRGPDLEAPTQWTGYISQEPLLMTADYLKGLTSGGVPWSFFSGATQGSANYVLQHRMGLTSPILIAMEDAPSKPDPTGLFMAVKAIEEQFSIEQVLPVIYAGDTVADMQTVVMAQQQRPAQSWLSVGILPPHVQGDALYKAAYAEKLKAAGASTVLEHVEMLTVALITALLT
ncbi:MAG: TIGR01548 family HAD-type hydrolase [Cyanobacteria bacterium P01_G01_bin.38]